MTFKRKTRAPAGKFGLAAAVLLLSAGCGGGGSGSDSADPTEPVVTQTAGIGAQITPINRTVAVGDRLVASVDGGGRLTEDATATARIDGLDGLELRQVLTRPDGSNQTLIFAVVPKDIGHVVHPLAGYSPLVAAFGPRASMLNGALRIGHRAVLTQGPVAVAEDFDGDGRQDTASLRREVELLSVADQTTPAGIFTGCMQEAATETYTIFFSGGGPVGTRVIRSSSWYAPGVGTVVLASVAQDLRDGRVLSEQSFGYTLTGYRIGDRSGGAVD